MAFVVYKSSAGSGKTATLVLEYLKLCLNNPNDFKRTLAITFTNKAANEMKSRIIDTLLLITENDNNFITEKLKTHLKLDEEEFLNRASQLLNLITHNYDEFYVSTIDSFVHKIIRTFTNELHLPTNFEIILDKDDIVPEILDELYRKIGHDKQLTEIILRFVFNQIEDEKTHNISSILSEFIEYNLSEEIFSHKQFISKLDANDFVKILSHINNKFKTLRDDIRDYAKKAMVIMSEVSIGSGDLANGERGIYGYFEKLQYFPNQGSIKPGKNALNAVENDKWVTKTANQNIKIAIESIKNELIKLYNDIQQAGSDYSLISLVKTKIYSVALIAEIQYLFDDFVDRTSKVHISDFNKKISDSIAGQPVPFIYERLGFKFKNFLIDEFQDTSVLQWENLLPLIEESLSNSNFSMLVGDSKQAIYRFRNGEVELFSNLPKIYNKDNTQLNNSREHLLESQYQEKVLEYNYRSAKNIVEFNNQFFENLINNETDEVKKHYSKLKQKDVKQHNSYIKLELINTLNKEEFLNEKHLKIESYIERAISSGFKPEDICYLARTKKSISALANYLISKDYNVVSSESLLVANSTKVSMIISLLYMMSKPAEKIFLADFIIKYAELNSLSKVDDLLIELIDEHSETYKTVFKIYNVKTDLREILSYSIYEICEYIIRVLKLNKESDIFLQFFLDFVYKAQNSGKYTLIEFLDYWEEKKSKIFINTPPKNDAINLMTAHKSKGLDFKVVIVDLNASLPNKSPSTWTDVRKLKIPKLEKTLVSLNMKSVEAGLEAEYDAEKTKERLDFINLMYVCFTRASHALFAISAVNKRNEFGKYLMEFIENNSNDELIFECGNLANKDLFEEGTETLTPVSIDYFPSVNLNNIIKISPTEEFDWNDIEFKSAESYGKIIHKILSEVRVVDDLKPVINKYINLGFIKIEEKDKVLDILKAVVMHPELVQFYSRDAIIKNEIDIYTGSGKFLRPDRLILINNSVVILDYKTGKKLDKHKQQIRDYINLIADFGYTNVEGLLVYLGNDVEVVKVH